MTVKVIQKKTEAYEKLENFMKELKNSKKIGQVGWFKESKYPDGTQVAMVAAIQEFGNSKQKIPPRPFMRPAIREHQEDWKNIVIKGAKQILRNTRTIDQVLYSVVNTAEGNIKQNIVTLTEPPLSQRTLEARARRRKIPVDKLSATASKPLVDTKILLNTLSSKVTDSLENA